MHEKQRAWRFLVPFFTVSVLITEPALSMGNEQLVKLQEDTWVMNMNRRARPHPNQALVRHLKSSLCPANITKCEYGEVSACCPLQKGVCCQDMDHCCPEATFCEPSSKSCLSHENQKDFHKFVPLKKHTKGSDKKLLPKSDRGWKSRRGQLSKGPAVNGNIATPTTVSSVFCPDGRTMCADNCTCCWMYMKCWGCCPYPNAVCCSDLTHCCPFGWTCNERTGFCQNTIDGRWMQAATSQCGPKPDPILRLITQKIKSMKQNP